MKPKGEIICPNCGQKIASYRNPFPTVDLIIRCVDQRGRDGIVLVERKNPPLGWALPGGFVDYGETLEEAAKREAMEETGLEVEELQQFHAYSDPKRDPRHHTITVVFLAKAVGAPKAGDDAKSSRVFPLEEIPQPLAFDHAQIIADYKAFIETGKRPGPAGY